VPKSPEPQRYTAYRIGTVYALVAFLAAQLIERFSGALRLDDNSADLIIIALALGFVPTVIISRMFAALPEGVAERRYIERLKHALAMTKRFRAVPDDQANADADQYQRR
jgi:hypothetical protein